MQVSVVIPTYNRCELLRRALDSVLAQTLSPLEIIVVDDGSSDSTPRVVRRHYPNVRYVFQPRAGVSAARNAGIRRAQGDWIAFLDSDDEWLPPKLERQGRALRDASRLICHSDEIWIRNGVRVNQGRRHRKHGGWIYPHCLPLCAMSPSSVLIHRSVFDAVGGFDETLPACEDYDLWLRICARYSVAYVDQPLLRKYGGHADQLSRRYWGMDRFRVQALDKVLASVDLDPQDRSDTVAMLKHKLAILSNGAARRNNLGLFEFCAQLQQRWLENDIAV